MIFDDLAQVTWIHGAPDCGSAAEPALQLHPTEGDIFVVRQSKCSHFEAPFMYLILGSEKALLIGTGALPQQGGPLPLRGLVDDVLKEHRHDAFPLVVAHSHSHGDHAANDRQFEDRPNTQVVGLGLTSVQNFFDLAEWPDETATLDLGCRTLTVIPIPGHECSHIAFHDPLTDTLFTGDTLYPGMLIIRSWPAYVASIRRLDRLNNIKPFGCLLGAHIEMTNTPRKAYPYGTQYQPHEHILPMGGADLTELLNALDAIGEQPLREVHDSFIIDPV